VLVKPSSHCFLLLHDAWGGCGGCGRAVKENGGAPNKNIGVHHFSSNFLHSIFSLETSKDGFLSLTHTLSLSLTWQDAFLLVWPLNLPDKNLDDNATTPQTPQMPERHEYADAALRSLVRTCLETQASLSSPLPALTSLIPLSAVLDARR